MEAADGDERAGRRGCGEGLAVRGTGPQRAQEPGDEVLRDGGGIRDALGVRILDVAVQIPSIGAERVPGESPLDVEMREPVAGGPLQGGRAGQLSTCSGVIESSPNASPTGGLVSAPAWVLRPCASAASARIASAQPWSASSRT